jgi:hypothetical protein
MPIARTVAYDQIDTEHASAMAGVQPVQPVETGTSAVAWGAIVAGAIGAAIISMILLILGAGLGLSAVSPWAREGISAATFTVSTIVWLIFTQVVAAAMGGYLAGRLRSRWISVHTDEVYFRDTAHGFLAWAVAALATAALLTSAVTSVVGSGIQAGASVAAGLGTAATAGAATSAAAGLGGSDNQNGPMGYFVDSLFRSDATAIAPASESAPPVTAEQAAEVGRILMRAVPAGTLPPNDLRYVGQIVAQRTGLTQSEAEQRVNETVAQVQRTMAETEAAAREAADTARKAAAWGSLWLFISLLSGAFFASVAAIYGGRQRDSLPRIQHT